MNDKHFNTLLYDLFQIYNPDKSSELDYITRKYRNGMEHIAIEYVLRKYNIESHKNYNPDITPQNLSEKVQELIEIYSKGGRINPEDIQKQKAIEERELEQKSQEELKKIKEREEKEAKERLKEITKEFSGTLEEKQKYLESLFEGKAKEIEEFFQDKLKNLTEKYEVISEMIEKIAKNKEKILSPDIHLKVTPINIELEKIQLPSSDILIHCGKDDRIIAFEKDDNGNPKGVIGLIVKEVIFEFGGVSYESENIKEIVLEKG